MVPNKFWQVLAMTALVAAACHASIAGATPTTREVCYTYTAGLCKKAYSAALEMVLVGSSSAPADMVKAAVPVCKTDAANAKLIKTIAEKTQASASDKDKFYHYFKFQCERG